MEMKKVRDIACGYGFTVFAVNDTKAHLYGTGLNKDGQIGTKFPNICERNISFQKLGYYKYAYQKTFRIKSEPFIFSLYT